MCKLFAGSSKMNQQKVCTSTFACESKLLVIEPAKSLSVRQFTHVQTFCWYDENEPAKSLHFDILHMCKLFAGSTKMNQQKVCTSTFACVQTLCWLDNYEFAFSYKSRTDKLFAGSFSTNQQKVCTSTIYMCANFLLVRRK